MMRFFNVLTILYVIMILLSGCRKESDIIVEMKTGHITRGEFHLWLDSRGVQPSSIYSEKNKTITFLRQLGVEKSTLHKALSENFDKTPLFLSINKAVYFNYLSSFYKEKIKKNLDFNEKAVELAVIKLFFRPVSRINEKDISDEQYSIYTDKHEISKFISSELNSGKPFEMLAEKFSEEASSSDGGNMGVYPLVMLDKRIAESILNRAGGETIATPIETENAFIFVKIIKWHTLNGKNAAEIINNNERYSQLLEILIDEKIEYIIADKAVSLNVEEYFNKSDFKNPSDILFSVNGEVFTVKEFADIMDVFRFFNPAVKNNNTIQNMRRACGVLLNERILAMISLMDECEKDPLFINKWRYLEESNLAGVYKYDKLLKTRQLNENNFPGIMMKEEINNKAVTDLKILIESDILSEYNFFINENVLL